MIAVVSQFGLDALDHARHERYLEHGVGGVGKEDADVARPDAAVGSAASQRPGDGVGPVVEFADRAFDGLAGGGGNARVVIEHPGDGAYRNAGMTGHGGDGGRGGGGGVGLAV